ncbi:MAG TPA: outer membrane beta-barrel protein [Candidatus Polarisedimenticolia bacterium]|nr:outer membrane beta-barrel protein [Candidatus Polarisedimenticolia bacterium]
MLLGGLFASTGAGWAGGAVEITPYYGYRLGGEFTDINFSGTGDLEIEDSSAYGLILSFNVNPNAQIDLQYSHQASELQGGGGGFLSGSKIFDLDVDLWQVGGNFTGGDPKDPVRGYVGFSLGVTDFEPKSSGLEGDSQFSFTFYGGAKVGLAKHLGLRLQGQWISTYIDSSDQVFCDPFGFCYVATTSDYLSQFEFAAGLTFKF